MDPAIGYALAAAFVVVGLLGMLLPALPGVPLVFAGLLLAAWSDGFRHVGGLTLGVLAVLTLFASIVDLVASAFGTRVAGASGCAFVVATLGVIVGLFFGLAGLVLGPFLGALLGEWLVKRDLQQAARAGGGAALGLILAAAVRVAVVFTMLGTFVLAWWID